MVKSLKEINWVVAIPILVILIGLIVVNGINADWLGAIAEEGAYGITKAVGWTFGAITLLLMFILAVLFFHPISNIRLGGELAKPDFGMFSWCAMALCSSIAIGIVFWGVAEPMYHYATPCAEWGIEPFSDEGIANALAQTNVHYAFGQYCYYAFFGILISLAVYNFGQPMAISSAFWFLRKKPLSNGWCNLINIICIFGVLFGVIYSLGIGIMQVGSGLNVAIGIEPTHALWYIICICVVACFTFSSKVGIQKGMKFLSDWNVRIYLLLMAFVLVVGPTTFITDMGNEATGLYIRELVPRTLFTGGPDNDEWGVSWTLFMFASVVVYGPIIGMFMAKISRGRTLKELLVGYWIVPSVTNFLWFYIFGGTGIYMQRSGQYDLWAKLQEDGLESSIFNFFQTFPMGKVLIWLFLICVIVSFVTLADASTGNVSLMMMKDQSALVDGEAPAYMKFAVGILMGIVAIAFIAWGGIFTVRRVPILAAPPVFAVTIVLIFLFIRLFFTKENSIIYQNYKELKNSAETKKEDNQ